MTQTQETPQQTQTFKMPSGATLAVTIAPFVDAWSLMKASLKTLKGMELSAEIIGADVTKFLSTPAGVALLLDRVADFATSPEVEAALWKCAERALYIPVDSPLEFPGDKVTKRMFDDPTYGIQAREDYSRIVTALMEVNCKPFLAKALSGLLKPKTQSPEGQPSK